MQYWFLILPVFFFALGKAAQGIVSKAQHGIEKVYFGNDLCLFTSGLTFVAYLSYKIEPPGQLRLIRPLIDAPPEPFAGLQGLDVIFAGIFMIGISMLLSLVERDVPVTTVQTTAPGAVAIINPAYRRLVRTGNWLGLLSVVFLGILYARA